MAKNGCSGGTRNSKNSSDGCEGGSKGGNEDLLNPCSDKETVWNIPVNPGSENLVLRHPGWCFIP